MIVSSATGPSASPLNQLDVSKPGSFGIAATAAMEHRRLWTYRTGGSNKSTVKYTQAKKGVKRPAQCTMKFMCYFKGHRQNAATFN